MSTTYTITEKTGYTRARISSTFEEARTFQDSRFKLNKVAVIAEANSIIRDAHTRYLHSIGLPEIGNDYSDEEDLEWNAFFAQPDVQAELERLAEEAETGEVPLRLQVGRVHLSELEYSSYEFPDGSTLPIDYVEGVPAGVVRCIGPEVIKDEPE